MVMKVKTVELLLQLGDCTLQLSNTLAYLDLDLSIAEQREEFENFFADG